MFFFPFINDSSFSCAEGRVCDFSQHIDIDLPDGTVSQSRSPKYEYSMQTNRFHRYDNRNIANGTACCTLLCGIGEEVLLDCINAIIQGAHTHCIQSTLTTSLHRANCKQKPSSPS